MSGQDIWFAIGQFKLKLLFKLQGDQAPRQQCFLIVFSFVPFGQHTFIKHVEKNTYKNDCFWKNLPANGYMNWET